MFRIYSHLLCISPLRVDIFSLPQLLISFEDSNSIENIAIKYNIRIKFV